MNFDTLTAAHKLAYTRRLDKLVEMLEARKPTTIVGLVALGMELVEGSPVADKKKLLIEALSLVNVKFDREHIEEIIELAVRASKGLLINLPKKKKNCFTGSS